MEVTRMWSAYASNLSRSEKKRIRKITEGWQIVHASTDDKLDIESAAGLPLIGEEYPGRQFIYCESIDFKPVSPILTIATANYSGEIGPAGEQDSPLNKPPQISWSDVESDEPTDEDFNGQPIVNVNGEPIEGVTMKLADNVVTIKKNFLTFNPYATAAYRHSVSSDTFLGYPPGTARLIRYNAQQVALADDSYWEVTASIQFRLGIRTTDARAWWKRVRNEGYYEKVTDAFTSQPILVQATDDNGKPMTRPVLLKSDGTRETDPTQAYWLEFQVYDSLPYNSLGLL